MPKIFYLPLATRFELIGQVIPHDNYFSALRAVMFNEEFYTLGELQGHPDEACTLYILGHGSLHTTITLRAPLNRALTPEELGAHLLGNQPQGGFPNFLLPLANQPVLFQGIRKIKVFACMSGVAPNTVTHSFAHDLGVYLRANNCFIPVYGYTGLVSFEDGHKNIRNGMAEQRAKERRVKFTPNRPGEKKTFTQEARIDRYSGGVQYLFDEDAIEDWNQF